MTTRNERLKTATLWLVLCGFPAGGALTVGLFGLNGLVGYAGGVALFAALLGVLVVKPEPRTYRKLRESDIMGRAKELRG